MSQPRMTPGEERPTRPELAAHDPPSPVFAAIRWLCLSALVVLSMVVGAFVCRELGLIPREGGREAAKKPASPEQVEGATAEGSHRTQLALAKIKQRQALDEAGRVKDTVAECLDQIARLEARMTGLLQDDEGRFVGARADLVGQLIAVTDAQRPSRIDVERLASSVEGIRKPLEASFKDELDGSLPTQAIASELVALGQQATRSLEAHRRARELIDDIVARAKATGERGTASLADAVAAYRRAEVRAEAERLERARTEAREQAAAKVAEAEAGKIRLAGEKEAALRKAEGMAEATRLEQERVRKLAEDPAIQARFQPLLAKGKWQFTEDDWTKISGPASYNALLNKGYLRSYDAFARAMAGWTNYGPNDARGNTRYFTQYSDRPRHKMPQTDEEWTEMKGLFDLFREVAPLWVEMGLLAK